MSEGTILNLDDSKAREMAVKTIRAARGLHRFNLVKCKPTRTLSQNALMWANHIPHVVAGIYEAWGQKMTPEQAHIFLRVRFLSAPVVNRATGEVEGNIVRSTTELTTEEFSDYLQAIEQFSAEYLNVVIPPAQQACAFSAEGKD